MNAYRAGPHVYRNEGNQPLVELLPSAIRSVLDVGCGAGANARLLQDRGCRVVGITLSEEESRLATQWCDRVIVADIESGRTELETLEPESFDVLLLSHVLEHMVRPADALCRLARYLREDGIAAVAVPNMAFWRLRWRFLKGDWERADEGWLDRTHVHFWSYRTAPRLFEGSPFVIEKWLGGSPAVPMWPLRVIAPRLCLHVDRRLGMLFPNAFATQVLLIAKKATSGGLARIDRSSPGSAYMRHHGGCDRSSADA